MVDCQAPKLFAFQFPRRRSGRCRRSRRRDLHAEIGLVIDAVAPVEPEIIPPCAAQRVHCKESTLLKAGPFVPRPMRSPVA